MGTPENSEGKELTTMESSRRHLGKFVSRIVKDFRQKELIPLKILFFISSSTLFVLYPYLTVHMRELGISVEETAIMSAITPIVAIIMPPLAGMVADKIGNFKIMLSLLSAVGGLSALLLLIVPVGRITVTYPDQVFLTLGCGNFNASQSAINSLELKLAEDLPCNRTESTSNSQQLFTSIVSCGYVCESTYHLKDVPKEFRPHSSEEDSSELSVDSLLQARSYQIEIVDPITKETSQLIYNLTREEVQRKQTKQESLSHRFMKNSANLETSLRRLSKNEYFLPTPGLNQFSCVEDESAETTAFLMSSRFSRMKRDTSLPSYTCEVGKPTGSADKLIAPLPFDLQTRVTQVSGTAGEPGSYKTDSMQWNNATFQPSCMRVDSQMISATAYLHNPENHAEVMHEINLGNCQPHCLLTSDRSRMCENMKKEIVFNPSLTFWSYLAVRVFIGIIGGTVFAMFEGAVIAVLRENNADYGLQRIYGSIGGMISSPLSGLMIEYFSQGKGYTDYRPAFYLYAGLKLVGGALMLLINLEFKQAADNVVSDVAAVLKKVEIIALLIASFVLATAWGYLESFLFWFLQDLGGKGALMGITITVGGIAGIPLLALSGPIINRFGHCNVIFMGFVFYAIRLLGYSLIYNPWHCLYFEAMESITSSLAWTASVTYAAKLSTPTTDSSIQGLLGGIYFGVGKGAGSLVGGFLMKAFGTRQTYQILAVFTGAMGCVYFCVNRFYLRQRPSEGHNDIVKKLPKKRKSLILEILSIKDGRVDSANGDVLSRKSAQDEKKEEAHDNPAFTKEEDTTSSDKPANNNNATNSEEADANGVLGGNKT